MHTREISAYGGLVERMPLYAVAFMVFTMANVGLPGTSGFVGEFLTLLGAFQANNCGRVLRHHRRHPVGRLCALALPPGHLRQLDKPSLQAIADLDRREMLILAPLVLLVDLLRRAAGPDPRRLRCADGRSPEELSEAALAAVKTAALVRALRSAMNPAHAIPAFGPALPEIILAVGVLLLVLFGAFRGDRSTGIVNIAALGAARRSPSSRS